MLIDVLIVGAGPTGLMAASLLARNGVNIRIIDKNQDQAHESRAIGVQAKTLELFQNIGIVDEVLKRGMVVNGIQLVLNGKKRGEIGFDILGRNDTPYSYIFFLSQAETEKILIEDLQQKNIPVERGIEAIELEQTDLNVTVTVKNPQGLTQRIQASYVIGADGAHSIVRELLKLSFKGAPYPQPFELADVHVEWPFAHDRVMVFLHGESFGAYFPLKGEEVGRVLAISSNQKVSTETTATTSVPMSLEDIQESFAKVTNVPTKLSDPKWLARFHIHHRGVNKYQTGRVFVAGDAAHIHSPVGAQGMNTGLQDAANLCWKLAMVIKKNTPDSLLNTYHQERWPVGQKLLNFTDRLFVLIVANNRILRYARDLFFRFFAPIATRSQKIRYRAFNFISQLGIRYQPNEFVQALSSAGLKPGTRAPNAKVSNDKEIFDLIKGYRFHLLVLSKTVLSQNTKKDFETLPDWIQIHIFEPTADRNQEIYSRYDVFDQHPQALYLIRPDGYIAYGSDHLDATDLQEFLKRFQIA